MDYIYSHDTFGVVSKNKVLYANMICGSQVVYIYTFGYVSDFCSNESSQKNKVKYGYRIIVLNLVKEI